MARSPDRATSQDRRSPFPPKRRPSVGTVARSGDRATTGVKEVREVRRLTSLTTRSLTHSPKKGNHGLRTGIHVGGVGGGDPADPRAPSIPSAVPADGIEGARG